MLGIEHGFFETLQGNITPDRLLINAMGAPCQPDAVWHACFPAMTFIPNLLITGIISIIVGLSVLIWATAFISRKQGGWILLLLSVLMLFVGGGFVSTFIGLIAGSAGARINVPFSKPQTHTAQGLLFLAKLWPWTLLLMVVWFPGSWIMGYFFNQAMLAVSLFLFLFFDIGLPLLIVFSAFAYDIQKENKLLC